LSEQEEPALALPEGALAVLLGISQLVYIVIVLTLGIRLALLARRTRKLPEALLCAHFLLCCSLGYLLLGIGIPAAYQPGFLPTWAIAPLIAVGHLTSSVGVWTGAAFNWLVFRREAAWARGLVWLSAITLATGYLGAVLSGGFSRGTLAGVWIWLIYGTYTAAAAWVMLEPLRHYAVMRRRLRLGLADPLVANRFLLWGIGSVCRFVMLVMGVIAALLSRHIPPEIWPTVASITLIAVAVAGLGVSVSYWLVFFPAPAYVRLITRRHAAVGA
jgi:hypothetical protein